MRKPNTKRQKAVLDILKKRAQSMRAYEILGELEDDEAGLAPSTMRRALTSLGEQGSAPRMESINAFVSRHCEQVGHAPFLTNPQRCGSAEEHGDRSVMERLTPMTGGTGFRARRPIVEAQGLCCFCAA